MESNDSPEIPDSGETSDIPGLPSGADPPRGSTITSLCFADDVDGLSGEEEELAKLVEHLYKAFTAYSMEISAEKTKLTNNTSGINTDFLLMDRSLRQSQASSTWA